MAVRLAMLALSARLGFALTAAVATCAIPAVGQQGSVTYIQDSVRLLQAGDLAAAETKAELALSEPATEAVATALLGSIRIQQKRYEQGVELLERAVQIDSALLGARLNLARAYNLLGKHEQAESVYRSVLDIAPDNAVARLELVHAASGKGLHREALDFAQPVMPSLRASTDGLVTLANAYAGVGDRGAAAALVDDWNSLRGVPPSWSIKFALSLAKGGLKEEAIRVIEDVKREGFTSFELAFNLAGLYLIENDSQKAAENYELALTFDDRSLAALRQIARIAEESGDYEKALAYLIRAKLEAPDDPDVLFNFGTVALRLELIEDGTNALERSHELRPEHKSTRYWLGTARGAARQYDAALVLYQGLLAEMPDDPMLNYAVGSTFYLKVAFEEAARYFNESCRLDPQQLMSYYYLAMIDQKQGRNAAAIARFNAILERHPEHALSHEGLAVSLFREGRYPEARTSFELALKLDPNSARASYQLGQLLVRMGLREEARQQLAAAKGLREEEERTQLVRTLLNPH